MNDDLFLIIFIHWLFFEQRLPVQVVEVVVLLFNIEALTIEHLIVNVLIMVRKTVAYTFYVFLRAADNVIKAALLHPWSQIHQHHTCIEITARMHAFHLCLFISVRYDSDKLIPKVEFFQVTKRSAAHHISIQVEPSICQRCQCRCYQETIEESRIAIREKQRLESTVIDQMNLHRASRNQRHFLQMFPFLVHKLIHKEVKTKWKILIMLTHR